MKLQINTQAAVLGWNVQNANLETPAMPQEVLTISTTPAKLELDIQEPQIQIDQSAGRSEMGFKSISDFMNANSAFDRQKISQAIGRIVSQGNELMAIENGGDPIPDQADYNAFGMFEGGDLQIVTMPKAGPKIDLIRGKVSGQYKKAVIDTQFNREYIKKGDYQPYNIEYFMKQLPSISINVIND